MPEKFQVAQLADTLSPESLGGVLPRFLFERRFLGMQLAQWVGLVVALTIAALLGFVLAAVARAVFRRMGRLTRWTWARTLAAKLLGPLTMLLGTVIFKILSVSLELPENAAALLTHLSKLSSILAAGWLFLRLMDVAAATLAEWFTGRQEDFARALIPVFNRLLKPIVALLIALVALQNVGLNVVGLLAGLGIGGIAVALAGQSTLENLFGSIAIAVDRPFHIGDFVRTGDVLGTVEDVGLRSTRIRTLDRTLVTIPNSVLSKAQVENFAARDRMRFTTVLNFKASTPTDSLILVIDELKRHLVSHKMVFQEAVVVRLIGHGPGTIQVEVVCWMLTSDWNVFTGLRERLLLDFRMIFERCGVELAPSHTFEMTAPSTEPAPEAADATRLVAERTESGELTLPEVPDALRRKLRGEPG